MPFVPTLLDVPSASFPAASCIMKPEPSLRFGFYLRNQKQECGKTPVLVNQFSAKTEPLFFVGLSIGGGRNGASHNACQDDHRYNVRSHEQEFGRNRHAQDLQSYLERVGEPEDQ